MKHHATNVTAAMNAVNVIQIWSVRSLLATERSPHDNYFQSGLSFGGNCDQIFESV